MAISHFAFHSLPSFTLHFSQITLSQFRISHLTTQVFQLASATYLHLVDY